MTERPPYNGGVQGGGVVVSPAHPPLLLRKRGCVRAVIAHLIRPFHASQGDHALRPEARKHIFEKAQFGHQRSFGRRWTMMEIDEDS